MTVLKCDVIHVDNGLLLADKAKRWWTAVGGLHVYSPEDRNDHLGVGIAMGKTYEIEKMNRPC